MRSRLGRTSTSKRRRADGGEQTTRPLLDGLTVESQVLLARAVWQANGYRTTERTREDRHYVLAKNDERSVLVRISDGEMPWPATLEALAQLRDAYDFDEAVYFLTERTVQTPDTDVPVADRDWIESEIERQGLAPMLRDRLKASGSETTRIRRSDGVLEVYPPRSEQVDTLQAVTVALLALLVGGVGTVLVYAAVPSVGLLVAGLLGSSGVGLLVGYVIYRRREAHQPALRIDESGIHRRTLWYGTSIPWDRITGVYEQGRTVTIQGLHGRYECLAIAVTEFDDPEPARTIHRLRCKADNRLLGASGRFYRLRTDRLAVDFEQIADTAGRYTDVPVETE